MNIIQCPGCKSPLNGRTCTKCGYNPDEESTVRCRDCGDEVTETKATQYQYNDPVYGGNITEYSCEDCI